MKTRVNFGKFKLLLLVLISMLSLVSIIINILFLAGVGNMVTNVPVAAGLSLFFSVLILIFIILIFANSYYKFDDTCLKIVFAFITEKIDYQNVKTIYEESTTKELYLQIENPLFDKTDTTKQIGTEKATIKFLVSKKNNQKIVDELKTKNPNILFDTFENEKKKKNK